MFCAEMNDDDYERLGKPPNPQPNDLRQYPWYYGSISRLDAENTLLREGKQEGTFLVREAGKHGTVLDPYRLSLLDWRDGGCKVVHYKIQMNIFGNFYIDPEKTFPTLQLLIKHYRETVTEMRTRLTSPCSRGSRNNTSGLEMSRDKITFVNKMSSHQNKLNEVWKGTLDETLSEVAIKKQKNGGQEAGERLLEEASKLKLLRHDSITRIVGVVTEYPTCIVTEFEQNQDVLGFLLKMDCYETASATLLKMAQEVAAGLYHMSRMKFVHRNVRAENVLIDKNLHCKLSGFSLARTLNDNGFYFTAEDDPPYETKIYRWMAIEGATDGRFSTASDIWSYAIFLHELFTKGEMPYADVLAPHVINVVKNGMRPKKEATVPSTVYALMEECWSKRPEKRVDFSYVMNYLESLITHSSRTAPSKQSMTTFAYPERYVRSSSPCGRRGKH